MYRTRHITMNLPVRYCTFIHEKFILIYLPLMCYCNLTVQIKTLRCVKMYNYSLSTFRNPVIKGKWDTKRMSCTIAPEQCILDTNLQRNPIWLTFTGSFHAFVWEDHLLHEFIVMTSPIVPCINASYFIHTSKLCTCLVIIKKLLHMKYCNISNEQKQHFTCKNMSNKSICL